MNSLIILPHESVEQLDGNGPHGAVLNVTARLVGARAQYAFDGHGVRADQRIKVAILGGMRGEARIRVASRELVELDVVLLEGPLPHEDLHLIVGVPRPQTIKKVVQAATMLGASSLHFVRSERGDKSYLQSRSLEPQELEEEVVKALEQIWDSRPPSITVHRSFEGFCHGQLSSLLAERDTGQPLALIGHPGGVELIPGKPGAGSRILLAIGPERGWSEGEVARFQSTGFQVVSLGLRVLRVEIALVTLLGRLGVG